MKFLVRTDISHFSFYYVFIYFNSFYNPWYYAHFYGQGSNHMYWLGQAKAKPKRTPKLHVSIINKPNNTLCYNIISVFHIYWPQLSLAWDFSEGDWFKILIYDLKGWKQYELNLKIGKSCFILTFQPAAPGLFWENKYQTGGWWLSSLFIIHRELLTADNTHTI